MSGASATCKDCGRVLHQTIEMAVLGEPREALVWADFEGDWICEATGSEHEPGSPNRPVTVTVAYGSSETTIRLSLAEADDFLYRPVAASVDDSELSWDLQEQDPERFATIERWVENLNRVITTPSHKEN